MNGWENVFIGELGASAALTGLVFVGISINLKKIMASSFLPNQALEALIAFVSTLFMALLLLIVEINR
jgi:modulator of FtsH protease